MSNNLSQTWIKGFISHQTKEFTITDLQQRLITYVHCNRFEKLSLLRLFIWLFSDALSGT